MSVLSSTLVMSGSISSVDSYAAHESPGTRSSTSSHVQPRHTSASIVTSRFTTNATDATMTARLKSGSTVFMSS